MKTEFNHMDCFFCVYDVDLPYTADFLHREYFFTPSEFTPPIQRVSAFEGMITSKDYVILGDVDSCKFILWGAVTARRSLTNIIVRREHNRFKEVIVIQPEIKKVEKPEEMVVLHGSDWRSLLIEYAEIVVSKMEVNLAGDINKNITGYCSWYYHYEKITEKELLQNMTAIRRNQQFFPAQYIQIDDGFQVHHGDWLSQNADWPTPLKLTVQKINESGFDAGIWTMPFLASTASQIYKNHKDWFVKDGDGEPITFKGWSPEPDHLWVCLDTSRTDVIKHLEHVYSTLYEWGFRYFKLDGLLFGTMRGIRRLAESTGISCYRDGLKVVKSSVKDSIVLACGSGSLETVGLVDNARVGLDTGKQWQSWGLPTFEHKADTSEPVDPCFPSLENALHTTLARWWQYDRFYRADPDVIMARQENTSLTIGEARMSCLAAIITGVAFTSDNLDKVDSERLELLRLASDIRVHQVRPFDWKHKIWPHVYEGKIDGKRTVAIFNFSDKMTWSLSDLHFSQPCKELLHPLGMIRKKIVVNSHDAALLVEV